MCRLQGVRRIFSRRGRGFVRRPVGTLVTGFALCLVAGSVGLAAPATAVPIGGGTWTWTGAATRASWSIGQNWTADTAPGNGDSLDFPALPSNCSSTSGGQTATCYDSVNDVGVIDVPSLAVDGTSSYFIGGDAIVLGSGGLSVTGAPGSFEAAQTNLALPIALGADQSWSIPGNPGLDLTDSGGVTQATGTDDTLGVSLSGGSILTLTAPNEVGDLSIAGSGTGSGATADSNGVVQLQGKATLNASTGNPVTVTDAGLVGAGEVGPLSTTGADVGVGIPPTRAGSAPGTLATASAAFDGTSAVGFVVPRFGATAGTDYSDLTASGDVSLGGAALTVTFGSSATSCFSPPLGSQYTLVSAQGTLTGDFSDTNGPVPDGGSTAITVPQGCPASPYRLRVNYNTAASPSTVVATVVAPTTTTITASPSTVNPGGVVTYSATVSAPSGLAEAPLGIVTMSTNGTFLCSAPLAASGTDAGISTGQCTSAAAPAGANTIAGVYGGDQDFLTSTGYTGLFVNAPTTTAVAVSSSSVTYGQSVTYSATVALQSGSGTPTGGSVAFTIGSTDLCTATVTDGSASCSSTLAPVGNEETVIGAYSGANGYGPSSGRTSITVAPAKRASTTTVKVHPTSITLGGPVEYTATVEAASGGGVPTGSVQFTTSSGAVDLCTATLTDGTGTCTAANAPLGSPDVITGTYSGDGTFDPSSGTADLTVTPAPPTPTTTKVSVSPSTTTFETPVTYSATVTPKSGSGTPAGTVTFSIGGTVLCGGPITLVNGTASCSDNTAPVGADTVTATYSGGAPFAASSGTTTLTVAPQPTTTKVQVSPSTVAFGSPVQYSATVTPQTGSIEPTGSVTFTVPGQGGPITLCKAALAHGTASCSSSAAPMGTGQTVTGTYPGSTDFAGSSGGAPLNVVPPALRATVTTAEAQPSTVVQGATVTYSALVAPQSGSGTPTGSVTFTIGSTQLCQVATLSDGSGSCQATNAPLGADTVTATYSGDQTFSGSSGQTSLTVEPPSPIATTTAVKVSPTSVAVGAPVTYSAVVTPASGQVAPSGQVAFTTVSGSVTTDLCTATLTDGDGSCVAADAPQGTDVVTGSYPGEDTTFGASQGTATLIVTPAPAIQTTTTVSTDPTSTTYGGTVTYTATVAPTSGGGTPTGTVTFSIGSAVLCGGPVPLGLNGVASCTDSTAPVGTDTVTAGYSGDDTFAPSSGTTTLGVSKATPTTTVTVSPPTVNQGQPVTYTAQVTPPGSGAPTGSVVFTIGTATMCSATVTDGWAACSSSLAAVGDNQTVTGAYSGDGNFNPSSGTATLTVLPPAGTTTGVEVSPTSVTVGSTVTYTATVTADSGTAAPTGIVTFAATAAGQSGLVDLCQATLTEGPNASSTGSCTSTAAPVGDDTVTGAYPGVANTFGPSSGTASLTVTNVTGRPTTTTVTATPDQVSFGTTVTYTATVAPQTGPGTPTGDVDITIDGAPICTVDLSGGTGQCTSADAPVGTDTVTGTYQEDTTFAGSTGTTQLKVTQASTAMTVGASPSPVQVGTTVTYSAQVTSVATGPITGSVIFTTPGPGSTTISLCSFTLAAGDAGAGSCTDNQAPVGDDTITGVYAGNSEFGTTQATTQLQVTPQTGIATTTAVWVSPGSVTVGGAVTYSADVTAASGTPTGTVAFTTDSGATELCTATLTDGAGSCVATNAPVDQPVGQPVLVTGSYSGDPTYAPSSGTANLQVNPIGTTTAVSVSPNLVDVGSPVTFTATVTADSGGSVPTGTVSFSTVSSDDLPVSLCSASLTEGTASCTSSSAPVGADTITGTYSGPIDFAGSVGTAPLTVVSPSGLPTSTAVSVSPSSVVSGNQVTYSATVSPQSGSGTPTGAVSFFVGSTPLCTATLSGGSGSCQSGAAPVGTDTVTGVYTGDSTYATSQGTATLTVSSNTSTTLSVNPGSVLYGNAVEYSVSVSSTVGVTPSGTVLVTAGPVTLCTVTLSGGSGDCFATDAPVGNNETITASYSGDSSGNEPSSATATLTVYVSDQGYWTVASDGGIFAFGDAPFYGSTGNLHLNKPVVGMAATPDGRGYWMVASDGGVFSFGDAGFHGSTGNIHLNQPIVGMARTYDGRGYWLVAADGGVFAFGDAGFYGSTGNLHLNKPVVGMAATPDGHGYWLVASDGGIFSFGDAGFHGSAGSLHLNRPVVGMANTLTGDGYWMVASDGGIFSYGDADFFGSTGSLHLNAPMVGNAVA